MCKLKKPEFFVVSILLILIHITGIISCNKEKKDDEKAGLSVSPMALEFEAEGGSNDIVITSNTLWTISNSSDWCTLSKLQSEQIDTVTITVNANEDTLIRSTIITITARDTIKEVLVEQKGLEITDTIEDFKYDIEPDSTDMRNISSIDLAKEMKVGWNIGNSLEAIGGETAWGNPLVSKKLIDSVKAAGFNAVRIPVAWSKFSDVSTFTIQTSWLERVEEVVNYVLDDSMYAIINIHWDGGWIIPTYAKEVYVNNRLSIMWKQIATHFRDYNDYLLFAGTNEVMVEGDYGTPTKEYYTVQNGYNQTFVTTVRKTGGRNAFRHLVVQGFNTNINHTISYAVMPDDVVKDRLMMEVHYYDPYEFALRESNEVTQWGSIATDPSKTAGWGDETWADDQFFKMKVKFVGQGIPVILGEYGAISRTDVSGHETYRKYYNEYITKSIVDHGLIPFYWDNGNTENHGFGIFNRHTGEQVYPNIVKAITSAVE